MQHKGQIKRHARSILVSRLFVIAVMVLLQLGVLLLLIQRLSQYFYVSYILFVILSVVVAISIANSHSNPSYKLAWIVPVLVFPLFGGVLYLLFGRASSKGSLAVYFSRILSQRNPKYTQDPEVIKKLEVNSFQLATESKYLSKMGFPVYHGSPVRYFSTTEEAFVRMKELICSAERYIFMEYFIVDTGEMWDELESLLVQKVSEGVEVRIIYDGMGSFLRVPSEFAQRLSKLGISVHQFMPVVPVLTSMHNNRDHRKMLIVDGKTAITGGFNIADEYINRISPFGHWKDTGLEIRGEAAFSMTQIFLNMWEATSGIKENIEDFAPESFEKDNDGFIQPFACGPVSGESVAAMSYLNLIHRARRYLYINTPYLVIDDAFMTALKLSAKSGVDVRIALPHIQDKKYMQLVARAYYPPLLKSGVRIFEYTPGFLHAKSMVADDTVSIVGTINMDFRSMYLQHECGVWISHDQTIKDIRDDFLKTLSECEEITLDSKVIRPGFFAGVIRELLRLFAPLL